jgi:alpha-glucosidase
MQLRYHLLPYFYTLAWEAAQKGYPPVRPLFWADWHDRSLWNIDDAFFLGDALLVCPLVQEGTQQRTITLPQGQWYHFWDDTRIAGGQTIQIEASLEQIPLLVKAGSILPMEDATRLILHLYPPDQGESESYIYSDAGDGYGETRLDRFRLTRQRTNLELEWEQQGDYPFPYETIQIQVHGLSVQQAWVDGQVTTVQEQQLQCHSFQQIRFCCSE